jgi:DNA-binding response OmpR family regulator
VEVLHTQLERANYLVTCAYDGEEGMQKYLQEQPHLIILDLNLPKMNGLEICRKIRREKGDEATPIIILTGQDSDADRIVGRVLGAEKYMTKPCNMGQLLYEISDLLEKKLHTAKKS